MYIPPRVQKVGFFKVLYDFFKSNSGKFLTKPKLVLR